MAAAPNRLESFLVFMVSLCLFGCASATSKLASPASQPPINKSPGESSESTSATLALRSPLALKSIPLLRTRNALPDWYTATSQVKSDWVASLHSHVVGQDWPEEVRRTIAKTLDGAGGEMFAITATGAESTIGVLEFTPAYLEELVQIVNYPLVPPDSPDPDARMLLDPARKRAAATRLAEAAGMLSETGYLDGKTNWGGGVVFGTRFLYYHELGHVMRAAGSLPLEITLYPEEEPFAEEIYSDQFALIMLALELRRQSVDLQVVGFSGVAFAMSLVALSEFAKTESEVGKRSIKGAVYRMGRIKHYLTRIWQPDGAVSIDAVKAMEAYWTMFTDLLRMVDVIPSPIAAQLHRTATAPKEQWIYARDNIVKWCTFGNCERVRSGLAKVYDSASQQQQGGSIRDVITFIVSETALLEPEIGLRATLQGSR